MNSTWKNFQKKLTEDARNSRTPLMGSFELTSRCNLSCKMCYLSKPANNSDVMSNELNYEQWISIAKEARDEGMLFLLLTGGEVFLRPDFKSICEACSKLGFVLTINTNATLITPKIAEWLAGIPLLRVGVSLYGASREVYGKVTGVPEAYDQAVQGIDLMLNNGVQLDLKMTVVKKNIDDYKDLIDFAAIRELPLGLVPYIAPSRIGCSNHPEQERLDPKDLIDFDKRFGAYHKEVYSNCSLKRDQNSKFSTENEILKNESSLQLEQTPSNNLFQCTAGSASFWIRYDGQMIPCGLFDCASINVTNLRFKEAWVKLIDFCSSVYEFYLCEHCSNKNLCGACPARIQRETALSSKLPDYLCQLTAESIQLNKKKPLVDLQCKENY